MKRTENRSLDAVVTQWDRLADQATADNLPSLLVLVSKARAHAILGQLYPFLSVGRLCLSRCIDYPFYVDVLASIVHPADELYVVEKTIGEGGWVDTDPVGQASSANAAVDLLASVLPRNYGAARLGSAEKWRDEFNRTAQRFRTITARTEDH